MKKILCLIDVQNDFIDGSLANKVAQRVTPKIAEKVRNFEGDAIIYTMDSHTEDYLDTKEGKLLPVEHCIVGTEGWKLNSEVNSAIVNKQAAGMRVFKVTKPTFGSTQLVRDIATIVGESEFEIEFCGFCTDICVVSNVLITKAAFYEQANINVNSALCAGVTPEKHDAALETMRSCQINVI